MKGLQVSMSNEDSKTNAGMVSFEALAHPAHNQ